MAERSKTIFHKDIVKILDTLSKTLRKSFMIEFKLKCVKEVTNHTVFLK
jgi:hypothetical protein